MFLPAEHFCLDPVSFKTVRNGFTNVGDDFRAVTASAFYCFSNHGRTQWIKCLETKFLELDSNVVHTQSKCNRCVNFESFFGNSAPFLAAQVALSLIHI